ncbi:hypothetical protein [Streptomyces lasalocidi]|uniref:Head-tail adaptor protein n=1 Tax=Streptomyces lasalocidi TaxID=324833 RepID=A0A4U5WP74_STRLS|nr:hypothetical protein [Streptomyces lasalocidi]TKT03442.1 hypothetical protein E4U91_27345 [Streptomyces lasalocidi]
MTLKAKWSIGIKRYQTGAEDAHGNPVESWGPTELVDVYAIAPTSSTEPSVPGREAVIDGLAVLSPKDYGITAQDRAVIGDDEYTIEGSLANWNLGPFEFKPGFQFILKKVNG